MITGEPQINPDVGPRQPDQEDESRVGAITAEMVADYLLCVFHAKGDPLTHLKLQKLVYYVQAWYLALYEEPLFNDRFEAWIHGPVVRVLYDKFKDYSWLPIDYVPATCPDLSEDIVQHIDEVLAVYGDYTAEYLECLVHREHPWIVSRGDLHPLDPSNALIDEKEMMEFYQEMGRTD